MAYSDKLSGKTEKKVKTVMQIWVVDGEDSIPGDAPVPFAAFAVYTSPTHTHMSCWGCAVKQILL